MEKMNRDEGQTRGRINQSIATTSRTTEKNINLTVNGKPYHLMVGKDVNPEYTLAYTLRETLGYTGVKIGCDHDQNVIVSTDHTLLTNILGGMI